MDVFNPEVVRETFIFIDVNNSLTLPFGRHCIVFVGALQKLTGIASGDAREDEFGQSGNDVLVIYVNCSKALTVSSFLHFSISEL